jgi:predicted alpha-1,2-mannosidase
MTGTKMKNIAIALAGLICITSSALAQSKQSNLSFVDPTIGSVGIILEPTRPTVHLPNSMVRTFPMRKDQVDDQISYFPLTVTSHRLSFVFALMPVSGPADESIWNRRFVYGPETTTPYYYSTSFLETGNKIEFTPNARSGYFRFNFRDEQEHYLRIGVINGDGEIDVTGKRIITGSEIFSGMKAYFYAELDADISGIKYRSSSDKQLLLIDLGNKPQTVSFRYGVSYISVEQAEQNLHKEIPRWNFDAVKNNAYSVWRKTLSKINVQGGTVAQKRVFCSSLYRCYERMVDINEYGKYYSAFDHKVHDSNEPFFVDNWIWDMYNALEPLYVILNPEQETYKIKSYIKMYEQSGWMPSFALVFGDWPAMTANHAAAWMADAWFKGLRNFDIEKAYEGLKKNSLEATLLPWNNGPATSLDSFYNKNGYMPGLRPGEKETVKEVHDDWEKRQSVSVTLENSYDDWCIAELASFGGHPEDRDLFLRRAAYYKNVFRVDKGFVWPKDADGKWIEPFNPSLAGREYFTENNAYTFNWQVKHDLRGLFELMGGRQAAEAKLDELFRADLGLPKYKFWYTQPDASGLVGQFVMGNEPSFHIPYIYNYLGAPWKTQKRIRMLLDTWFTDNIFGFPGDEDGGGMSSFVVFSMMGFYPVTPGIPVYNIGSPVFNRISINLPNGKTFVVIAKNNSATNIYVQSATLNGKPLSRPWFTHNDLIGGGTLELIMGEQPNRQWGDKEEEAPPSEMNYLPGKE